MMNWLTKFMWALIVFVIIVLILGSLGIGYYICYAALEPLPYNEKQTLSYMYSEYPHLRDWWRKMERKELKRDTVILSADSVQLHAILIPASKPTDKTAVVIHGHRSSSLGMLHIAYMYQNDLGMNVLLPDLRTHGKSGGTHVQMGWLDRLDALRWTEVAHQCFNADKIVVHGISMGAATTMMLSGEPTPDYVRCYVEDCGYTSVWEELAYVGHHRYGIGEFPFMYIANEICKYKYGWDFREASSLKQVGQCTKPMLFIHGDNDTYVPSEMIHRLYQAKPCNKAIWEAPGTMHARAYHDYPKEYTRQVKSFVNSYFYAE